VIGLSNTHRNMLVVDLAGVEPASRTLFSLLHTAITLIYRQVFRAIQCCISCTRHASPQGSVKNIRLPLGVYMVLPSLSTPINPINILAPYEKQSLISEKTARQSNPRRVSIPDR